ncbi:MAG: AEC family transporter [Erysipelotrichaceae bacterium]|nr:AEC family transporter [Erysipelotrichaceae bacterium]
MLSNIIFSLSVVLPMTITIAIGYFLKRINFISDAFLKDAKRFCFYVLLPVNLFKSLYDADIQEMPVNLILFSVIGVTVIFLLSSIISKFILGDDDRAGVVAHGMFRSNFSYIGLPLASQMFSDANLVSETLLDVSLVTMFAIPLSNVLSTIVLSIFSKEKANSTKKVIYKIVTNPCIIGILVGVVVVGCKYLFNIEPFFIKNNINFLYKVIGYIATMATPFSLIVVGAGLDIKHGIKNKTYIFISVSFKNIVFPIMAMYIAYKMNCFNGPAIATLIAFFASPTAVSSAIMAAEMGGDYDLANEIVVVSTVFSSVSLFIIIYAMKALGCL